MLECLMPVVNTKGSFMMCSFVYAWMYSTNALEFLWSHHNKNGNRPRSCKFVNKDITIFILFAIFMCARSATSRITKIS